MLEGDDGRIELTGNHLVLTFAAKRFGNSLKKAIGVRVYPLAAVADLVVQPHGHGGHPTLQVVVRPGCDLLRPLLKNPAPGPDADPDVLILSKGGSSGVAEVFVSHVRGLLDNAPDGGDPLVDSGKAPFTLKGLNSCAEFNGETLTLDTSSWTATAAKKAGYPRHIPASAVADVALVHPGMKGRLRFVLAGAPDRNALVDPKTDLDTVELTADSGQSYAVLAAAVLTAARRAGVTVREELLPNHAEAPVSSTEVSLTSGAPKHGALIEEEKTAFTSAEPLTAPNVEEHATELPSAEPVATAPTVEDQSAGLPSAEPATAMPTVEGEVAALPPAELVATAPGTPAVAAVPQPSWRERRAEKRAVKEHQKALASWQAEQNLLDRLATVSRAAVDGGGGAAAGIILKTGESLLWDGSARLVEIHRESGHYQGGYSGVSFRIAKGVRYSVGGSRGHYVPGPEVQMPVDAGRVVVTTQRVLFTGSKTTREWSHAKFISIDTSSDDHVVMIHVSNRQKVSGLSLGKAGTEFTTFLSLGITIAQHGAVAVAEDCERTAASHRNERP